MEKCDGVREATDKNITWHMCTTCWKTKATGSDMNVLEVLSIVTKRLSHQANSRMLHHSCMIIFTFS